MTRKFDFRETEIKGLFEITPFLAEDNRGSFLKDYSEEIFAQNGINCVMRETFYSTSAKGVIRGMHFQKVREQAKLVRCISGDVFDVVADIRKDSPTFKKYIIFRLKGDNGSAIFIPEGCAHGFMAVENSLVSYKCGDCFAPEYDSGIRFDDPDLSIEWDYSLIGGRDKVIISDKDKGLPSLKEYIENC